MRKGINYCLGPDGQKLGFKSYEDALTCAEGKARRGHTVEIVRIVATVRPNKEVEIIEISEVDEVGYG